MRYEIENMSPAGSPSSHRINERFSFNSGLTEPGFSLVADQAQALAEWSAEVESGVREFHAMATSINTWCPDIRGFTGEALQRKCANLKSEAAQDSRVVIGIYRTLDLDGFPDASILGPEWAIYRQLQAKILFYLDHIGRYGFPDPDAIPRRVEHDLHDIEYALIGTLAGALATCDRSMAANFKLMAPDGVLLE